MLQYLMPWDCGLLLLRCLGPQIPHGMTSNVTFRFRYMIDKLRLTITQAI